MPVASGAVSMARAVPAGGQSICVGGIAMVVVTLVGVTNRLVGATMPWVGVAFLVTGGVFGLQAMSRKIGKRHRQKHKKGGI
ncbi:MAG: hypothetical protein NVSMB27_11770 [Ktedonobacteraceae bacterium]